MNIHLKVLLPIGILLSLYKNYSIWEVFYIDERGNRDDKHTFHSENEACEYIYEEFKRIFKNLFIMFLKNF